MTDRPESGYPLEPPPADMQEMGAAVVGFLTRFVDGLADARSTDLDGASEVAALFDEGAPEAGSPFDEVLGALDVAVSKAVETAGPGYLAYIPGGGLYTSALGNFIAAGINRFGSLSHFAPALAQIEASVLRWLADLFAYPAEARGILTTGGSLANLSAIATARQALLPEEFLEGTLYASAQAHHSILKAARLVGFPARSVRSVPCDEELRIDVEALNALIGEDRSAGLRPFCIVANAGTTNTGAVDPLEELATVADDEGMWLHVDAAYGGPFQLTKRGRGVLAGIGRASSITLDPHKAMFLPYGTGALLVRDGATLRDAHRAEADYMQDIAAEGAVPDFTHYSPELSREIRGLRLWLPIKLHGLAAFREALDEKLDLTRYVFEELRSTPGFEVPWEPVLTIVAFRHGFGGDADALNAELLRRINASGRVFLSSTRIGGRFFLRVCIVSHRTHRDRIEECVDIIRRTVSEIEAEGPDRRTPGAL